MFCLSVLLLNSMSTLIHNRCIYISYISLNWFSNWKSEISHVANKVSKSIGIIRKSNFYLSTNSLRTLYFSLVYPYFFYCNLVWASTYKSNLVRLEILQKRVVRTIAKTHFYAHTDPIFRNLGIFKISWHAPTTIRFIHVLSSKPYSSFKIRL